MKKKFYFISVFYIIYCIEDTMTAQVEIMRTRIFFFMTIACAALMMAPVLSPSPSYAQDTGGPEPPVIVNPKDMDEIRGEYIVTVIWNKAPGAASYHMIVSKDRMFRDIIYENPSIMGASQKVEDLDFGTYFIKIRSISASGSSGGFGGWLGFIIVPPSPERLRVTPF